MSGSFFEVGSWVEERQLLRGSRCARGGRCGVVMARSRRDAFVDVLIVNVLQLCTQSSLKTYGQVKLKVSNLRPFSGTGKCGSDQLKLLFAEAVSALGEGEEDATVTEAMVEDNCNGGTMSNYVQRSFTTFVLGEEIASTDAVDSTKADSDSIGREAFAHDDERHAADPEVKEATVECDRNDSIVSTDIQNGSTQMVLENMVPTTAGSGLIGSPNIDENTPSFVISQQLAIAHGASSQASHNDSVAIASHDASEDTPLKRRRRFLQEEVPSPRKHTRNYDLPIACQLRVQWWRQGKMKEIKGKRGTQNHSVMLSTASAKPNLCTTGLSNNLRLDCSDVKQVHANAFDSSKAIMVFETQYMAFYLTISGADPVQLEKLIADVRECSKYGR